MSNHNEGVTKIRRLVSRQKVLLVLDDVDHFQRLESLGISPNWFHEGSRIIVTTRDKRSLGSIPYALYEIRLLNRRESLNLFTRLMFARDGPINTKFIEEVAGRAGGIPLVLKVWSSHFQRSKKLFLDIACFFDNAWEDKHLVVKVSQDEDLGFFPNIEIKYLVDKSLVEITSDNELWMHHAIREMGLEIVRQENEDEPGHRTRLSDKRDVMRVLTECSSLKKLRILNVSGSWSLAKTGNLSGLENLEELDLSYCRNLKELHSSIGDLEKLVILNLKSSVPLKRTPWKMIGKLPSLQKITLGNYDKKDNMESFIDEGNDPMPYSFKEGHVTTLELHDCNLSEISSRGVYLTFSSYNLEELHSSVGDLEKLVNLNLKSSVPLKRTPWEMIGKLPSLQKLTFGNYDKKDDMESFIDEGNDPMPYSFKEGHLTTLKLYGCNLSEISSRGVVTLASLKHLYLENVNISSHCDILLQLHHLNTIEFYGCHIIQSIPNLPENIICSSLVNLPCNISELKSLTVLKFYDCEKLRSGDPHFLMKVTGLTNLTHLTMCDCSVSQVPFEIGNLVSLKELDLSDNPFCSLPDNLSNLSQLLYLNIEECHQLRLLPLLPPNLKYITAFDCRLLDVTSSAFQYLKVCYKVCNLSLVN
ncbi:TMV resistance protein N-like [Bidens hawaiensis]|uniref:TMV resistance protein N-like n=1 Tax=Bidens hawaiensis TaxID=980011 RepID=UPI00404B9898